MFLAPGTSNNINGDSGITAGRRVSGPSSSDGPSNELAHLAASASNIRAILVNIRQPSHRNYRKRNRSDRTPETDSNSSSRDSDDFSAAEDTTPPRPPEDQEPVLIERLFDICSSDNSQTSSSSR